jgi:hypothetical protein
MLDREQPQVRIGTDTAVMRVERIMIGRVSPGLELG